MPDAEYGNPTAEEHGWNHCMSVPRELHWDNGRLTATPVRELEQLRGDKQSVAVSGEITRPMGDTAELILYNTGESLRVQLGDDADIVWKDGLLTLTLSEQAGAGRTQRVAEIDRLEKLQLLVDTTSLELFLNGGQQVMSTRYYPNSERTVRIAGEAEGELYRLNGMTFDWNTGGRRK
ncbi:MAG: GH32 C-terminal domain-containing protein, partial [Butyricicoccus sp.]